jgi:hypothetical protein
MVRVAAVFSLGLMAKPMLVTLPVVLLLIGRVAAEAMESGRSVLVSGR